jgi:MFS family permease
MSSTDLGGAGWFHRSRTIAKPGFSRWMVPPAALCVHLCIGQAYAYSVFNLPMTRLLGNFIGRRNTYFVFFALGAVLYALVPWTGSIGSVTLYVLFFLIIISMYGGGFATVPAYLRDMFGTRYVGAIHGLLLTAWSMAGIFGPVIVNYMRAYNVAHGVPKAQAYNTTMYVMAVLLVVGFICNYFVKAVHHRFHMKPETADVVGVA